MKAWRISGLCALLTVGLVWFAAAAALGAGTNVSIVDFAFSPTAVTIGPNDSVTWNWVGSASHSSTSANTTPLWDSGILAHGATFSHTFNSAGTFPYHCLVHSFMTASVTVQSQTTTNVPPTVAITTPTNGATFPAPWTGTIKATVGDSDGTVTKVDFMAGTKLLGTITNPPGNTSLMVSNLAAGSYTLTAVATDNGGASTTSAAVNITVVSPATVMLGSAQKTSAVNFQFSYSATPGLNYAVDRSIDLHNWSPVATNNAASGQVTFRDTAATRSANFYRVRLVSGP